MRGKPKTGWQPISSPSQSAEEAHAPERRTLRSAVARSTRAVALAAVAVGLAVFATAGDRLPSGDGGSRLVGGAAAIAAIQAPQVVEAAAVLADVDPQVVPGTPTPLAGPELSVDAVAADETADLAADDGPAVADELVVDARASLSDRSGTRAAVESPELVAELAPDVVAVSDKLESARAHAATLAALLVSTAKEGAALSVATAVQATPTPKPVVKVPTPKPAPKVVVRKPAPTPKPVVRTVAKPATTTVSNLGQRVVTIAMRYLGYRYSYGGISPSTGFDCSGFTYYVYLQAGRPISRSLSGQYGTGRYVSRSALQPGDLLFFHDTSRSGLSHAAIYIGGGRFINSQSERVGVAIASLGTTYWSSHYLGARRP